MLAPMTDLASHIAAALDVDVAYMTPLGGGDVADSYRVQLDGGITVFAKTKANAVPGFFTTEAAGLTWLREANAVAVPQVLAVSDEPAMLIQEWIEPGYPTATTEADLGRDLAALHRAGAPSFGRQDRRSTGSRGLPNDPTSSWAEFYAQQRLIPLARLAREAGALPEHSIRDLETVADLVETLVPPEEPPSRLHGDLWGGNRLIGVGGVSWLIDPGAFGGHREFDLSMMRLFGGFGADCYAAYANSFPLHEGWEQRVPLHQLAPLVIHSIKFGSPYVPATQQALNRVLLG
jgi:fructosamine-3-kinase